MSFKVKIEIEPYDNKYCRQCHVSRFAYGKYCGLFSKRRNWDCNEPGYIRLPECLEAEKKYKEKLK